jgi:putative endopeptidase
MIARLTCTTALCALIGSASIAQDAGLPDLTPDLLAFSVDNMDASADPRQDFYRYASGGWLDRVERPAKYPTYGVFLIMTDRVTKQVTSTAAKAAEEAANAPKGSPTQIVGDFYKAFMDVDAIEAAGIEPIRFLLDEVDAIESFDDLTRVMGRQALVAGPGLFAMFGPAPDPADNSKYAMFSLGQTFAVDRRFQEILRGPVDSPALVAYKDYMEAVLAAAGYTPDEASRIAALSFDLERTLYAAFLSPAEAKDPSNKYGRKTYDEVRALVPDLNLDLYLETIGFDKPETFYMFEPRALPAVAEVWRTTPLEDLKDYAKFRIITTFSPFLTDAFYQAKLDFDEALLGTRLERPRSERIYNLLKENLGHPASQLFVSEYYDEQTKVEVLDMIEQIKAVFRQRIVDSPWLSDTTRTEALQKVDKFYYKAGYPDKWVDYSSLDIGSDPVRNIIELGRFSMEREIDKMSRPPETDEFNAESTLPIVINAAYNPGINGFEVTAAITQPPAYSSDMDPALRFCRVGAIIGHEMTHGFDFSGRQFDSDGNFRNWWTDEDTAAFVVEARKLIDQADAYEVLPGVFINGQLGVGENMADVGGITLAYEALMDYLAAHPEEDVEIDGLTQAERCFIGWAQLWTSKYADQYLQTIVVNDGHAPDFYRAVAALQHVDAWYETFGIEEGDPMWLPPEKRSRAW